MRFSIPGGGWSLILESNVLQELSGFAQQAPNSIERVGQLYSRSLSSREVVVARASVLSVAHAHRSGVVIDRASATSEREMLFREGWHCAGMWHSHPERHPKPSAVDHEFARDYADAAAEDGLAGIVFVIVGTEPFPSGLYVAVHDGKVMHQAIQHASVAV